MKVQTHGDAKKFPPEWQVGDAIVRMREPTRETDDFVLHCESCDHDDCEHVEAAWRHIADCVKRFAKEGSSS